MALEPSLFKESGYYSIGRVQVRNTLSKTFCIQFMFYLLLSFVKEVSGEVDIDRYGYVDKTSGFRFTYEDMESDQTVFPGEQVGNDYVKQNIPLKFLSQTY